MAVVSASEYAATIRHPLLVPTTTKGGRQAGKAAPETPTPETPTPGTPTRQACKRQVSGLQSDAIGCKGEKAYASGCKGMQAKKQGGRGKGQRASRESAPNLAKERKRLEPWRFSVVSLSVVF